MTEPDRPLPDHVPDRVLEELMDAFSTEPSSTTYDFDDPSIDRLLGVGEDDIDADADTDDDDEDDEDDEVEPVEEAEEAEAVEPAPPVVVAPVLATRRTIVIAEDDQPDAVYLDPDKEDRLRATHGAADDSAERSTIVISDLDEGRSVEALPARSDGGIDPRIRARRVAVRRAEGHRRLIWAGVATVVVLLLVGAIAVIASPLFDVERIDVQGAVYTDDDVLQQVTEELLGDPVLLVDTRAVELRLEQVPWVERARVATDFPHRVVIDIRERQALATFQGSDGRFRVIDVQGRVLDVIDNQPIAYVLITGINPDTARGQFAGPPYASAADLALSLPPDLRAITETIGVDSATGTLTMQLDGGVSVRLGDARSLDQKLARLLQQVRDGLDGVVSIDVSTDEVGVVYG